MVSRPKLFTIEVLSSYSGTGLWRTLGYLYCDRSNRNHPVCVPSRNIICAPVVNIAEMPSQLNDPILNVRRHDITA